MLAIEPVWNTADGTWVSSVALIGLEYAPCPNGAADTGYEPCSPTCTLMYFELFNQSPHSVILPFESMVLYLSPITLAI